MKKENSKNKKKKKYNWEYHEKLNQKYETYLIENLDKNNLRLKGNYHYENKPVNYYLNKKEVEPINNSNLTPIPLSKYLNHKTKEQNFEDYKKYSNIQKSVVEMRRIEYNANLNKKKKNPKKSIQKEKKEEKKIVKRNSARNIRYSCIEFGFTKFFSDNNDDIKVLNKKEILDYIFKNKEERIKDMPNEIKNYLTILIPALTKIQNRYRKHFKNLKSIVKIQANFRAHYYNRLFKEYSMRKDKITRLIYIIQKVLLLNLYHLKVNPNKIYSSSKCFYTKKIFTNNYINKLIFLQKEIKLYLSHKNLKRIYGKKKCVYIKPITQKPLGKIRLLQKNIILFLERLHRRHTLPTSQRIIKKKLYTQKLILIQRFAKAIHEEVLHPLISKENFNKKNIFVKSNRKYAHKKGCFIDTQIIPFNPKKINIKIKSKETKITKLHKYIKKIIFLQKYIKEYLARDDYDIYDYPKCEEYITKESFVLSNKQGVLLLQRQIKYFLYRQKIRDKTIKKVVIIPLKITKSIRTNTEKIFMRLSKLRIMYDKNIILFIIKIIEVIKRYLGNIAFRLIVEQSRKKKIFSIKGRKYVSTFSSSKIIKNAIYKVVEPQYKFTPIKKLKTNYYSNKNTPVLSFLNIDKKDDLKIQEEDKKKMSEKKLELKEESEENIEEKEENDKEEKTEK